MNTLTRIAKGVDRKQRGRGAPPGAHGTVPLRFRISLRKIDDQSALQS
jgi:hypothetical protein